MNSQDTVLTDEQIAYLYLTSLDARDAERKNPTLFLMSQQAEASFKAGQQVGRQEVADWVKEYGNLNGSITSGISINRMNWGIKLKEWGIEC
jgi:hypothetical protein